MEPLAQALCLAPAALAEKPPPPINLRNSPQADAAASRWAEPLPDFLVQLVFVECLPADARARCGSVCRAWAHALLHGADAWRCWTRLDLSGGSGVRCTKSDAALEGAVALARGRLQQLDLGDRSVSHDDDDVTLGALVGVLRGSPELRELALDGVDGYDSIKPGKLQQLLAASAPTLQWLDAEWVLCEPNANILPLLRGEPPYGPLRMGCLEAFYYDKLIEDGIGSVVGARRFAAAVAHARVRELKLHAVAWAEPAALEALVDALLARTCRVEALELWHCEMTNWRQSLACVPAMARLLAGGDGAALTEVGILDIAQLRARASEADVELVCAALRRTTLTFVGLSTVGLTEQSREMLRQAAAAAPRLQFRL